MTKNKKKTIPWPSFDLQGVPLNTESICALLSNFQRLNLKKKKKKRWKYIIFNDTFHGFLTWNKWWIQNVYFWNVNFMLFVISSNFKTRKWVEIVYFYLATLINIFVTGPSNEFRNYKSNEQIHLLLGIFRQTILSMHVFFFIATFFLFKKVLLDLLFRLLMVGSGKGAFTYYVCI